jgi:hypothetical protein
MDTHIIYGVPIEVDNVQFSEEGEINDWDVFIGGVEITATVSSDDFFQKPFVTELERLVKKHAEEMAELFAADAMVDRYLDRRAA